MSAGKLKTREIAELAVITALLIGAKEAMNALPNINPVTLLLLVTVLCYGWKALYVAFAFTAAEFAIFGAGLWTLAYIYVWPLLIAAAMPFRANRSPLFWSAFSAVFGLCFGALCSIPYLFLGGWRTALSWWVAGIPYDLLHAAGNAVLSFLLLLPLYRVVERTRSKS